MTQASRTFAKYRLLARLGHGGMADVYLSVAGGPGGFNKLQVLKVLRPHLSEQADFLQMFEEEGRLAARLNHPNIVQTNEVGMEGSRHFIAMEYLDGQPLHRVKQRARESAAGFPLEMELLVLCQVLEALEYAHGLQDYDGTPLNIVHRDVTPQNVFVTYAGQTKLVDFGIAKTLESSETQSGVLKGKVAYMAPEQAMRDGLDQRADLFSVGVMLWEAIGNRRLYSSRSEVEILHRLIQGDLTKIREVVPDLPLQLEQIVDRALALNPDDRYPNAGAFRTDLVAFLDSFRKVTSRDVGERVTQLFAEEREELGQVIRQEMTDVTGPDAMPAVPETMELPSLRQFSGNYGTPSSRASLTQDPGTAAVNLPIEVAPPASGRRWLFPALVAVFASGLVALLLVTIPRGNETDGAEAASLPSAEAPSASPSVRVRIEVAPKSATLTLGGAALATNPYEAKHPRHAEPQTLEVSAPGYVKRTLELKLDRDVDMRLELSKDTASDAASAEPVVGASRPSEPARPAASKVPEPFGDLPPPKRPKPRAPSLDKGDPWSSD